MNLKTLRNVVNELYQEKIQELQKQREIVEESNLSTTSIDEELSHYRALYAKSLAKEYVNFSR